MGEQPGAADSGCHHVAYPTTTLTAAHGTAPYPFAVTGGALPPGLTLTPDGTLSGTPSAVGTFSFTVTATDSLPVDPQGAQAYTVAITAPGSSTGPPTAVVVPPAFTG